MNMNIKRNRFKKYSLISSILLTALMFYVSSFFIGLGNRNLSLTISAWIMIVFYNTLFFLILYTGRISFYRRIFFFSAAIIFFPSFIAILYETRGSMLLSAEDMFLNETPFCHIVTPMTIIPYLLTRTVIFPARLNNHFASIYSMLVIWLTATITIGKGWCSWVCFYGGWDDGISRFSKKAKIPLDPEKHKKIRLFNYVILFFVILASLSTLTAVYCEWLCPFKIITEFEEITGLRSIFAFILFTLLFFILVIILPFLTRRRFQCTAFCPFGAFQSLIDGISAYRVRINPDECISCMKCVKECPTMSLTEEIIKNKSSKPLISCTKCGECIEVCPKGAISYTFAWNQKPWKNCKKNQEKQKEQSNIRKIIFRLKTVFLEEILSPQTLFIFSAFLFGTVISSGFGKGTILRFIHLLTTGSFLLPY